MTATARARLTFLGPAVAVFAVVMLVPILATFGLAFASWTGFDLSQIEWNGTANFKTLFEDPVVGRALIHTLVFVVVLTVMINVIGLGVALLVNTRAAGSDLLRVAMFLPLGLSPVVTAILWQFLLGPYGFVNQLLVDTLGVTDSPIGFLGEPDLAFVTIIVATLWAGNGVIMLIFYSALQSLPAEKLEAAAMDGAGWWSRLRFIVLPHLRPALAVAVLLSLISGWKVFDIVFVLTQGGPDGSTEMLATYLYKQAFQFSDIGFASVLALLIAALAILSTAVRRPIAGEQY